MDNKPAKKKKLGRPYKYTPEQLQAKIDQYFQECETKKEFPNISNLALALEMRRETIWDYAAGGKNKFNEALSNIIKNARDRIEGIIASHLLKTNGVGSIFYLKSVFGYKDKSEVEIKHKGNIKVSVVRYESGKVGENKE